ncbi:MAG: nucleotidyltransferase domain-containing protein [Heliobacteriaceae bacterium]|jgi:predicted nucleotidyltransferase|nr:nucleotidyltransferase domain-containing protein [Heliobacteriaceae bacterium]
MKKKIDEIARKLSTALKETFDDFEGLYLYGSQVRGDATKDSDIDIVALVGNVDKDRAKRRSVLGLISRFVYDYYNYDIDIDFHPMTRQELEHNYYFYDEVVNKGVFYGA